VTADPELIVFEGAEPLFRGATEALVQQLLVAAAAHGNCSLVLSGGMTPRGVYLLLAADTRLDWARVHVFWGDERNVPPDHPDSNFRMAHETLLSKVPIPAANIHRVPTEDSNAEGAAAQYEVVIRTFFGLTAGEFPRFDVVLLGLGPDGHTASLFPGSPLLNERRRIVAAVRGDRGPRITLTPPAINHAACVMCLVSGGTKAVALRAVLREPADPLQRPAQAIRPISGRLLLMADADAASLL
jgi:6-phosphogluconolactonase